MRDAGARTGAHRDGLRRVRVHRSDACGSAAGVEEDFVRTDENWWRRASAQGRCGRAAGVGPISGELGIGLALRIDDSGTDVAARRTDAEFRVLGAQRPLIAETASGCASHRMVNLSEATMSGGGWRGGAGGAGRVSAAERALPAPRVRTAGGSDGRARRNRAGGVATQYHGRRGRRARRCDRAAEHGATPGRKSATGAAAGFPASPGAWSACAVPSAARSGSSAATGGSPAHRPAAARAMGSAGRRRFTDSARARMQSGRRANRDACAARAHARIHTRIHTRNGPRHRGSTPMAAAHRPLPPLPGSTPPSGGSQ